MNSHPHRGFYAGPRMSAPILQPPVRLFECPSCGHRHRTRKTGVIAPMHRCPDFGGIDVPLQAADRHGIVGPRHSIDLVERGDWIGREAVQHGGVMAVHARRRDGSHDTTVFAPTAEARNSAEDA